MKTLKILSLLLLITSVTHANIMSVSTLNKDSLNNIISNMAEGFNEVYPKRVNDVIMIKSVRNQENTLTYIREINTNYAQLKGIDFQNSNESAKVRDLLYKSDLNHVCKDNQLAQYILSRGAIIGYATLSKSGETISVHSISKKDCRNLQKVSQYM